MIPRRKLDIGWTDLLFGACYCLWQSDHELVQRRVERAWSADADSVACLSVRSGFDLVLQALALPPGSEILVSAITIHDMVRIIEHHRLVPVPVDLDMQTLALKPACLARARSSNTKAILVAHLFGSVMPMDGIVSFARQHGLYIIEDCAQAYAGARYRGHPDSDVRLWSFGPIKTATALGGAILTIKDPALLWQVKTLQARYPVQHWREYLQRLGKYAVLKLLGAPTIFGLFVALCRAWGKSHDLIISAAVRGFAGPDLFARLRRQPCVPLLALLARRLEQADHAGIDERSTIATKAITLMPSVERPGARALQHTHWVFPIYTLTPELLARHLWQGGFDATSHGSSLYIVPAPGDRPQLQPVEAQQALDRILYLPVYPGVSALKLRRLAGLIAQSRSGSVD